MPSRTSKVCTIEDAIKSIPDGSTIAIGGVHMHNSSMVAIRELIRQEKRDLEIIGSISLGIQIDMLIGAHSIRKVTCPFVGLEIFGLAPNYRRAVEAETIEVVECCEMYTSFGLRAGANDLPFMPLPYGYEWTDLPKVNSNYRRIKDPYGGPDIYTVPALKPDVALIHTQLADAYGNGQPLGPVCVDDIIALASERVILTCDTIVEEEPEEGVDVMRITLPGFLVSHVVQLPYAAHPCSSSFLYEYDTTHFQEYAGAARKSETFEAYLDKYVYTPKDHYEYLTEVGGLSRLNTLKYKG